LCECHSVGETRSAVDLLMLILIAAAFGVDNALEKTGAANAIATVPIEAGARLGPVGVLAAIYLATALLTEVIANAATVALVFPIALAHQCFASVLLFCLCCVCAHP
jgi:di/tricarboxylate transporter